MILNWIECGLPWRSSLDDSVTFEHNQPEFKKVLDKFGVTLTDLNAEIELYASLAVDIRSKCIDDAYDFIAKLELDNPDADYNFIDIRNKKYEEASLSNPDMARWWSATKLHDEIWDFIEGLPEYQDFLKDLEVKRQENKKNKHSFSGRGLNIPGTLIELEDGKQYLLGHVNCSGGSCNDCMGFPEGSIVKRYVVLLQSIIE